MPAKHPAFPRRKRRTVYFDHRRDNAANPGLGLLPHLEAMLDPNGTPCKGGPIRFVTQGSQSDVDKAIRINTKLFKNVLRDNVASFIFLPLTPNP